MDHKHQTTQSWANVVSQSHSTRKQATPSGQVTVPVPQQAGKTTGATGQTSTQVFRNSKPLLSSPSSQVSSEPINTPPSGSSTKVSTGGNASPNTSRQAKAAPVPVWKGISASSDRIRGLHSDLQAKLQITDPTPEESKAAPKGTKHHLGALQNAATINPQQNAQTPKSSGTVPPFVKRRSKMTGDGGFSLSAWTIDQREKDLAVREQRVTDLERTVAAREQQVVHKENTLNSLLQKLEETMDLATKEMESRKAKPECTLPTIDEAEPRWHSDDGVDTYLALSASTSEVHYHDVEHRDQVFEGEESASRFYNEVASLTFSLQQLQQVKMQAATQLWFDPVGTDLEVTVTDIRGNEIRLPLHRNILESKCGWLRQQISFASESRDNDGTGGTYGDDQDEVMSLKLDMNSSMAIACFFFAYTEGKSDVTMNLSPTDAPTGEQLLQICRPDLKESFDLTPVTTCIHLYGAALQLQMPELCSWLLKQIEVLATSIAESVWTHRFGGLATDPVMAVQVLRGAMSFLYEQGHQLQWRPMQIAFAGLYDVIALRIGPYLTFDWSPEMMNLVIRLHEDHLVYRQSQMSCLPRPGSLAKSSEKMKQLLEQHPDDTYYG